MKHLNKRRPILWPPFYLYIVLINLLLNPPAFADPAGKWGGLFNINSGDEVFRDSNGRLMIEAALSVAVSDIEPNTVFLGTTKGLYKSTDNGAQWTNIEKEIGSHIFSVATKRGIIYVSSEKGLFKSRDNGKVWERLADSEDIGRVLNISFDPRNEDALYISSLKGLFKSSDSGRAWKAININLPEGTMAAIISQSPPHPPLIPPLVRGDIEGSKGGSEWGGIYIITSNALYKSTDGGETWRQIKDGIPDNGLFTLAFDPANSKRLYLSTDIGIFISNNAGKKWGHLINERREMYYFPKVYSLIVDPVDTKKIYAGTEDGLLISDDGGRNWLAFKKGLPSHLQVGRIVSDPRDGNKIYLIMSTLPYKLVWEREVGRLGMVLKLREIVYLAGALIIMISGSAIIIYKFRRFYKSPHPPFTKGG
ncbi:MAG: hypothetical protein HY034_01715 [Nitrospirae bacterium]|nr:hypothetical protein [Nitrospirota bacterium]